MSQVQLTDKGRNYIIQKIKDDAWAAGRSSGRYEGFFDGLLAATTVFLVLIVLFALFS